MRSEPAALLGLLVRSSQSDDATGTLHNGNCPPKGMRRTALRAAADARRFRRHERPVIVMHTIVQHLLTWGILGVMLSIHVLAATACHCDIPTPPEARDLSDATFVGEILGVQPDSLGSYQYQRATVRVEECWKGALQRGATVYVWTPACLGCCGELFIVGEHLVLYVRGSTTEHFYTDFCLGNIAPIPWVLEALGPPGCSVGIEQSSWTHVKRLFADP